MVLMKLPFGRAFLAGSAWALLTGALAAQGPVYAPGYPYMGPGSPGFYPGYGYMGSTFGATGLGTGTYGLSPRLSLGISGGSGGDASYGVLNRYGRVTSLVDREPLPVLSHPLPEDDVAHLRVIVPSRDAELWVNDTFMTKQGTSRTFISPFLTPGKHFVYDLRVRYKDRDGRVIEQSRSIVVHAGSSDVVDFRWPEASPRSPSRAGR